MGVTWHDLTQAAADYASRCGESQGLYFVGTGPSTTDNLEK
jgi:hypothetical protein